MAAASAAIRETLSLDVTFMAPNNGTYAYYYKGRLTTLEEYHRLVRQDAAKLGFKVLDFKVVHVGVGSAKIERRDGRAADALWAYQTSHRVVPNLVAAN